MSKGAPNSAKRCAQLGTLGAAISVLLLLCLDTNATARSTKRITDAAILYIDNSGMTWQRASGTEQCGVAETERHPVAEKRAPGSSRRFCVTTVSIVCTIKAPVPVRAEDGLDPPYLHGR